MDRYDIMTIIGSALLSLFAFVAANQKPDVQYIDFKEPIVIAANKNIQYINFDDEPILITSSTNK